MKFTYKENVPQFTVEKEDKKIIADCIFNLPIAQLTNALLRLKAIETYAATAEKSDGQYRTLHVRELERLSALEQLCGLPPVSRGYSTNCWVRASQEDIRKAYELEDRTALARLYDGAKLAPKLLS